MPSASARSVRVFSELNPEPRDIEGCGHWSPSAAPGAETHITHEHVTRTSGEPGLGMWAGYISKHMSSLCLVSDHCNANVCTVPCYSKMLSDFTMSIVLLIETASIQP